MAESLFYLTWLWRGWWRVW